MPRLALLTLPALLALSVTLIAARPPEDAPPVEIPPAEIPPAEIPPAATLPCFPGAYYRKAVSSTDVWTGFDGVVTLPTPTFDPARTNPKKPGQYLDNPSVYIGGRAGPQEIDAGLTWEVIRLSDGTVSPDRRAFRPFWRNKGWFAAPARPELYFFPGDTVRLRIETAAPDTLTLTIRLISRGAPAAAGLKDFPPSTRPADEPFTVEFKAPGFGPGKPQEFKRVNAIDQVGREGKPVDPTAAHVDDALWLETHLLRGPALLPFTEGRYTDMRCPSPKHFTLTPTPPAGERITIRGTPDSSR